MVELLPRSPEHQEQWQAFFADLKLNQIVFDNLVTEVSGYHGKIAAVARLLSPGRSGARVVVVSFHDDQERQQNLVIKLVAPGSENLLLQERSATERFGKLLYPDLDVRVSPSRAVAYSFVRVLDDFGSWLEKRTSEHEIAPMVEFIFDALSPWYRQQHASLLGFFDSALLEPSVQEILREADLAILQDLWSRIEGRWPKSRGTIHTICHGDLNPTNILILGPKPKF